MMANTPLKSRLIQSNAGALESAIPDADLQNSGFLVDTLFTSSRLQQGWYGAAGLLVIVLIGLSGLPLWLRLAVILLFIGLTLYWLKLKPLNPIIALWQSDSRTWYWQHIHHQGAYQGAHQKKRGTGELAYCRHLGYVIQLGFKSSGYRQPKNLSILVWRDQVSQEQWRRLMVVSRLRPSSSTLLG